MKKDIYKIEDICEIKSGKRLPKDTDFADCETDYPYIRARDIKNGKICTESLAYLEKEVQEKIKRYIINSGDIVLTIAGTIGEVGYATLDVDGYNLTENAVRLTSFAENVNSKYLFYTLQQKQYRDYMQLISGAAAQPKLGLYKVQRIKIELPDIETQNKIADILSTYDELIENNNKRIAILEQMAENLYKEWFVRFRFPGYKDVEFENGIPKGWKVVKLGDYVEVKGGKRLPEGKKLQTEPTQHPYIRIRDITTSKFISLNKDYEYIDNETFDVLHCFVVDFKDIIISIVGTIGSVACVSKNLVGANLTENCVKLVNSKHFTNSYLYHALNSKAGKASIQSGIVGATQPKLPIYNIKRIKLLKPQEHLIKKFTKRIEPIDEEIMHLMDMNQNLIKQRDLLLPRLMSGKLEV